MCIRDREEVEENASENATSAVWVDPTTPAAAAAAVTYSATSTPTATTATVVGYGASPRRGKSVVEVEGKVDNVSW